MRAEAKSGYVSMKMGLKFEWRLIRRVIGPIKSTEAIKIKSTVDTKTCLETVSSSSSSSSQEFHAEAKASGGFFGCTFSASTSYGSGSANKLCNQMKESLDNRTVFTENISMNEEWSAPEGERRALFFLYITGPGIDAYTGTYEITTGSPPDAYGDITITVQKKT